MREAMGVDAIVGPNSTKAYIDQAVIVDEIQGTSRRVDGADFDDGDVINAIAPVNPSSLNSDDA